MNYLKKLTKGTNKESSQKNQLKTLTKETNNRNDLKNKLEKGT